MPEPQTLIRSGLSAVSPRTLSKEGSLGRHVRNTFIHFESAHSTSLLGSAQRSRSMPKDIGSQKSDWDSACNVLSYLHCTVEYRSECGTETAESSTECDTDEHVSLENLASDEDSSDGGDDPLCRTTFASIERLWSEEDECLFPTFGSTSWPVRNTFIDWAPTPTSPLPGIASQPRSRSMPKCR